METETLVFQIDHIVYSNGTGFFIVRTTDGEGVSGKFNAKEGYCYQAQGQWDRTSDAARRYGPTFKVESAAAAELAKAGSIAKYLAIQFRSKGLGVGEVFLTNLGQSCEDEGLDLRELLNHGKYETLIELVGKRNAKKVGILLEKWPGLKPQADLISPLLGYGLTEAQAEELIALYGNDALKRLKADPYGLITVLDGISFLRADRIARTLGVKLQDPVRLRAAIATAIGNATSLGDLGVTRHKLLREVGLLVNETVIDGNRRVLDPDTPIVVPEEMVSQMLDTMLEGRATEADGSPCRFSAKLAQQEDEKGNPAIWFRPLLDAEDKICERLGSFNAPELFDLAARAKELAAEIGMHSISDEQLSALRLALTHPVIIVTGGPGTGKSYFLKALLHAYARAGLDGHLAAPTGKAAKRISEATGRAASTMHALIGYRGGADVQFSAIEPLQGQFLVIDEASMSDVSILALTLDAVRDNCRVVLLGDVDQLPSVGPGQVLRDLIRSERIPVVRFTHGHRFSGGIATAARAINAGQMPESSEDGSFVFVDTETPHVELMEYARSLYKSGVSLDDIQILSPTHKGASGCQALNLVAQSCFNPNAKLAGPGSPRLRRDSGDILIGDRVIQVKNMAAFNLMNGDMAWLDDINQMASNVALLVDGRKDPLEIPLANANHLNLGYAITVHKSQGAEAPYVLIAVDRTATFMLRRNLIYTAVTRGKEKVVVFASKDVISRAAHRGEPQEGSRRTLLAKKLRERIPSLGARSHLAAVVKAPAIPKLSAENLDWEDSI